MGAGIAAATIPGSIGRINGCYEKRTGILRVIDTDAAAKCTSFETPISWNQQGQKGPTGAAGQRGPTGAKGEGARTERRVGAGRPAPRVRRVRRELGTIAVTKGRPASKEPRVRRAPPGHEGPQAPKAIGAIAGRPATQDVKGRPA